MNINNKYLKSYYEKLEIENIFLSDRPLEKSILPQEGKKCVFVSDDDTSFNMNMENFEEFEYFIGFGNTFYRECSDLVPSKILDGYLYNDEFENAFPDKEYDLFIIGSRTKECSFTNLMIADLFILLETFELSNLKIGSNIDFMSRRGSARINKDLFDVEYIDSDFIPLKYMNNSNIIYSLSMNHVISYCCDDIHKKTLFTGLPQSILYKKIHNNESVKKFVPSKSKSIVLSDEYKMKKDNDFANLQKIIKLNIDMLFYPMNFNISRSLKFIVDNVKNNDMKKLSIPRANEDFESVIEKIKTM